MKLTLEEINDLRKQVLAGRTLTVEEYRAVVETLSNERSVVRTKRTKKQTADPAKKDVLDLLFGPEEK